MQKASVVLIVFIVMLFCLKTSTAQTQNASPLADSFFIVEDYYKIKWGYANEFIDLWKKNHYPLLKKTQESGDIIEVRAEKPTLHSGEDTRWDFKVTIIWKNAELGVGKEDPTLLYQKPLYPDIEKLKREEQHRF
jgi:hypothetical protein